MVIDRKWDDAIHYKPDSRFSFNDFWKDWLKQERNVLIISGLGWDPRMTALLSVLKEIGGSGLRHLHKIFYSPSKSFESPYKKFIDKNNQETNKIIANWAEMEELHITTRKEGNSYIGDEELSKHYINFPLNRYTDVIVDISSLPKSLYFTLLLILVTNCDKQKINLHIVVCQDVEIDNKITETADDVRVVKGFKGKFERLSQQNVPKIWAPVLARQKSQILKKLHDRVGPTDIYPILPFPNRNPRHVDDLLIEYNDIFNEWGLDPLNIIYAAEDDPLDVYRRTLSLFYQQQETLEPLGGILMAVSALSSKLSSVGVFMAAFEEKKQITIFHPIGRHSPPEVLNFDYWGKAYIDKFRNSLHSIWLTGEPYAT